MTDLAMREEHLPAYPVSTAPSTYAMSELLLWAQGADAAYRIAERLAVTSFVPGPLQRKPQEIAAAILTGKEIGLEPMAALRSINVIQGTPTINAQAMRGLVQSAGHEVWVVESTATRCIMRGKRAGSGNIQESVWTLDRARGLALLGKDNWRKQPQAMLVARATAEICRWVGSDVLIGVPYATEELQDDATVTVETPAEVKPAKRTAQRAPRPEPEPAPEPGFTDDAPPAESLITKPQNDKLHAQLRDLGKDDRDAGLALLSDILGRPVESTKKLTFVEASDIIDELDTRLMAQLAPEPEWPTAALPDDYDGSV